MRSLSPLSMSSHAAKQRPKLGELVLGHGAVRIFVSFAPPGRECDLAAMRQRGLAVGACGSGVAAQGVRCHFAVHPRSGLADSRAFLASSRTRSYCERLSPASAAASFNSRARDPLSRLLKAAGWTVQTWT